MAAIDDVRCCRGRDWTQISVDVLADIVDHLLPIDRCRFRAVCSWWNKAELKWSSSSTKTSSWKEKKNYGEEELLLLWPYDRNVGRPPAPWLMVPVRRGTHHAFCNIASSSPSFFRLNYLPPIRFVAGTSPGGWLLHVDDYGELHALNIFTLDEIDAPPLATFSGLPDIYRDDQGRVAGYLSRNIYDAEGYTPFTPTITHSYYYHALIHFPKNNTTTTSTTGRGRYVIVVIHGLSQEIAFAWEGDKSWRDADPQHKTGSFYNLVPHNGLIYAVDNGDGVISFDPNEQDTSGSSFRILGALFYLKSSKKPTVAPHTTSYVVEISGELWVVARMVDIITNNKQRRIESGRIRHRRGIIDTEGVVLYKLDKEANKWLEVDDFGEEGLALFLGSNQSMAVSTRDLPHLKPGCIYFTDSTWEFYRCRSTKRGVGVFDVRKGTFKMDYEWCPSRNAFPPPVWVLR